MQQTSIRITKELRDILDKFRVSDRETYEDVIWNFIEPHLELKDEIKKEFEKAKREKKGYTLEEIEKIGY